MEDDRSRAEQTIPVHDRVCHAVGSVLLRQVNNSSLPLKTTFDGEQTYRDVLVQMGFWLRITGTEGNRKCAEYLIERHAYRIFGLIHSADSKET
jgi:hypothetical protein